MNLDSVLEQLGNYGRYQTRIFLLIGLVCLRNAWNPFIVVFIAAEPPGHCRVNDTDGGANETGRSVPVSMNDAACYVAHNDTSNAGVRCPNGWAYDESYGSTIVTEWDLVCERGALAPLSTSVYMMGVMFGALFVTPVADYFGRKAVMIACILLQSGVGVALAFVDGVALFSALRFLIGALNQGAAISGYVLVTELYSSRYRTRPCIGINVFWALGVIILGGLAYFIRNWRHLQLAISAPCLLMVVYYVWVSESLPWLLSKRRYLAVDAIIRKMALANGRPPPRASLAGRKIAASCDAGDCAGDVDSTKFDVRTQPNGGYDHEVRTSVDPILPNARAKTSVCEKFPALWLFSTPRMALSTCVVFYLWTVNSLNYYGISFALSELSGDRYVNFILGGLVEVPAHVICMFLLERFGRRVILSVFHVVGGISLIIAVVIPVYTDSGATAIVACGLIGKFCVTSTLVTVYLYSAEIFPTPARNSSVGLASFWETVGSVAAPFVVYSEKSLSYMPSTIFGCMSLVAGLLAILLPETLNQPLPDTVRDIERLPTFLRRRVRDVS